MEKKTIGGFIAALRKANGMTQKDLAEQLNVSDKTVSRWELDDGAPDLAVIPVIAEIFNVTCDELLRGERKSPTERAETTEETESTPQSRKTTPALVKVHIIPVSESHLYRHGYFCCRYDCSADLQSCFP